MIYVNETRLSSEPYCSARRSKSQLPRHLNFKKFQQLQLMGNAKVGTAKCLIIFLAEIRCWPICSIRSSKFATN